MMQLIDKTEDRDHNIMLYLVCLFRGKNCNNHERHFLESYEANNGQLKVNDSYKLMQLINNHCHLVDRMRKHALVSRSAEPTNGMSLR